MAWKDPRGSTRVVATAVRHVAHSDDAKSRTHDASQLAGRGFPTKLIVGGTSVGLVVVGAVVAVFALNGRGDPAAKQSAGVDRPVASAEPSVVPAEDASPSPEEVLAESQPSGVWRFQTQGRYYVTRAGAKEPTTYKQTRRWTFTATSCAADKCTGTVASTSGLSFPYVWNGNTLVVRRPDEVQTDPKAACVDDVTREPLPIAESAVITSYRSRYGPFRGTGGRMRSSVVANVSYEFFGTCDAGPTDPVKYVEYQVITQLQES